MITGGAAPKLWHDMVTDELAAEVEFENGVHGGVENGLENGALVDAVKHFLEVDFEDGQGVVPFKAKLDGALDGVQGFCRLWLMFVPTLCF